MNQADNRFYRELQEAGHFRTERAGSNLPLSDQAYWLDNRAAIIEAIEQAGFRLMSNQHGFWLAALAPASPHKESHSDQG